MRVIVCGDRKWGNGPGGMSLAWKKVRDRLRELPRGTVIIEGGAPGADSMGKNAAQELGLPVVEYPANWDYTTPRGAAGPIRNAAMLSDGNPDLVLAFHNNIKKSKGSADMVARARKAGVEVEVIE